MINTVQNDDVVPNQARKMMTGNFFANIKRFGRFSNSLDRNLG